MGLRDALRKVGVDAPRELIDQWHEITAGTTDPLIDNTLLFNQHRGNEMAAQIAGPALRERRSAVALRPGPDGGRRPSPGPAACRDERRRVARSQREVRQWDGIVDQLAAVGPVEAWPGPRS